MKKRDIFWFKRILLFFLMLILFISVSIFNIVKFNATYISAEIVELNIFKKQIIWAITPILQKRNYTLIQKYADDFKNEKEFSFRIFDENKKLIVSSKNNSSLKLKQSDTRLLKAKHTLWELYKHSFKDKNLELSEKIIIDKKTYYLEVSISERFVINSIISAQKNVIILFIFCLIILLIYFFKTFYLIRASFNSLEDSVRDIANGNLDRSIIVPKNNLLEELAVSVTKMSQKLKTQIKRLSKLEEYKNEFIQNITHEIKTPVTAINCAIEYIEETKGNKEAKKECLDIIKFQTNLINKLSQDILSLSEIDLAKTQEIKNFEKVNMETAAKEAINNQGIVECRINIENKEKFIIDGNHKLLVMMISNLLSNAIMYSKTDKIDIIINKNSFMVRDYGIGIEKKYQDRIFEKFFRIDKSGSRKKGGSGLGLSIVKNIAQLHNLDIKVESKINKGTSFILTKN